MNATKKCPVCDTPIKGRSDKIFCSVQCKSINQYENRQENEKFFLQVDRQLKINRKLLKRYNKSGFTTLKTSVLKAQGFNPNYFTHYWRNQKGDVYLFVYEYGFMKITHHNKDKYLLVTWQPYMNANPSR